MFRAMLRDLRAHKGRIAMTLVAIVLGVAFVVATWVLSDSTAASLSARPTRSDVDVAVRAQDRGPVLDDEDLDRLAALPGVTQATGVLASRAALVGSDGKIVAGSHDQAGTGWDDTGRFTLTSGRAPRLLGRRGGLVTRLATRNAVRDPRRTAATSSALLLGLALVCAFATLGETMVSTLGAAVRNMVPPTATILRSASGGEPLGTDVLDRTRATPGVTAVAADRYSLVSVRHEGNTTASSVSAIEPTGFTTVLTPKVTEGSADLRGGVVVDTNQAAMMGAEIGDEVDLEFPDSKVRQRIVGLIDTVEGQPLFYLNVDRAPTWFRDHVTTVYATGTNPTTTRQALEAEFQTRPDVAVTDREGVIATETADFQLILAVMYAMFGAAIVIAVFGVINTLALSVTERSREIGVLRAVGAPRRMIRRMVRVESVVICGYGGVLGIAVGILFGAVMQHTMLGRPLLAIEVPTTVIATALAGMVAVGVLSAIWPARRASRTRFLDQELALGT